MIAAALSLSPVSVIAKAMRLRSFEAWSRRDRIIMAGDMTPARQEPK